jgi:hypothetical protein
MDSRKFFARQGFAAALFLLGFASSATAIFDHDLPPTNEEAHAFLGGTFQRYQVAYAGDARQATRASAYTGDGCVSQLGRGQRALKVNWSAVSAVEQQGDRAVELQSTRGNMRVYFPNERATRSAANAFEVLRSACVPPVLTARR